MAKTSVADWDTTAADNTDVGGISLAENVMKPPAVNDAFREIMAQIAQWTGEGTIASAATCDIGAEDEEFLNVTGTTTITSFGTVRAGTKRVLLFAGALTLTHNATSLILRGENITTRAGDVAVFASEGSGNWRLVNYFAATQPASRGHIYGLTISNNSTDSEHDLDIAVGEAASDDATPVLIKLASALTKQADATFAEGTGTGGMISGESLPTSGTIHIWLIMKADGTVDVCFNNQASSGLSPTLPTGFVYKRRIGSLTTNASANIVAFLQGGDHFELKKRVGDFDGTQGTTAALIALSIPTGLKLRPKVAWTTAIPSTGVNLLVTDPDTDDEAPSGTIFSSASQNSAAQGVQSNFSDTVFTDTTAQLRFRSSVAGVTLRVSAHGWVDSRGRF